MSDATATPASSVSQWLITCVIKLTSPRLRHRARLLPRQLLGADVRSVNAYLRTAAVPRLHIGCGKHPLAGWLNSDYAPAGNAIFLNATRAFPLPDNAFRYVYSEHMIEHVPYAAASTMLRESFRVLQPGGVLRIVTPNLKFLIALYQEPELPLHRQYIAHSLTKHVPEASRPLPAFTVNNFVRNWGHQFIYDRETLELALQKAGFCDIRQEQLLHSRHPELQGLENTSRMPEGFLELESLVIEATKPS